jgi:sulfur carrier protein
MIHVNGVPRDLAERMTVGELVASVTDCDTGCAVAVNGEVVPRRDWAQRQLMAGDRIEILTAVQGG